MKYQIVLAFFFLAINLVPRVKGHAYPICIKFANGKCEGYMRHMSKCVEDDYRSCAGKPHKYKKACNAYDNAYVLSTPYYTEQFPLTKANPGEERTMQWHPRNHALQAGDGQDGEITKIRIFMSPNPVQGELTSQHQDADEATFKQNEVSVLDFGNKGGSTNGPVCDVSQDPEKGTCQGTWKIPQNLAPGTYTFWVRSFGFF